MKIFLDSADLKTMVSFVHRVQGVTTNPTLMRQAGVTHYETFAREVLREIPLPVSFAVTTDSFIDMEGQAHRIQSWGTHAVVKIPITNTLGFSSLELVERLLNAGISVNVTAIMTKNQLTDTLYFNGKPITISIFAGRIADAGNDPIPMIQDAKPVYPTEILWASTRELLNIRQAEAAGCSIITMPPALLDKMSIIGRSLQDYSLETVQQFHNDAQKAAYTL